MELDGVGQVAQVGDDADLDALRAKAEADRIDGVVRNGEAVDFDIADREAGAGLKRLDCRERAIPLDGGRGQAREIDRRAGTRRAKRARPADVVGMLVRDQNGVDAVGLLRRWTPGVSRVRES